MGKVHTSVTITNNRDEILAQHGLLPAAEVRTITLERILIDTGADTLCLPQSLVDQLGLGVRDRLVVSTANGITEMNIHSDAHIAILGRDSVFDCIALPDGSDPLLGVIPMEWLGLEPDLANQVLRVLPRTKTSTHLHA
ncbi:MAG: aspartyl protease family protein [Dehalococcoidia bacterium]|nr:aspartyl protease family protein [Dehalococcoidia bacterium]